MKYSPGSVNGFQQPVPEADDRFLLRANSSDGSAWGWLTFQTIDLISGSTELAYWVLPQAKIAGAAMPATEALSNWAFTVGIAPLCA